MSCDWHPINEADHSRNKEDDRDYDVPDEGHVKALSHRPADHDSSNVAMRIDFDNSSLKFRWRRIWRLLLDLFDSHLTIVYWLFQFVSTNLPWRIFGEKS
jgi:hypothetical protein